VTEKKKQDLARERVMVKRLIRLKLRQVIDGDGPADLTETEARYLLELMEAHNGTEESFGGLGPTLAEVHAVEAQEDELRRREAEEAGVDCCEPRDHLYPPDKP
jgi:hypothetical protein